MKENMDAPVTDKIIQLRTRFRKKVGDDGDTYLYVNGVDEDNGVDTVLLLLDWAVFYDVQRDLFKNMQ